MKILLTYNFIKIHNTEPSGLLSTYTHPQTAHFCLSLEGLLYMLNKLLFKLCLYSSLNSFLPQTGSQKPTPLATTRSFHCNHLKHPCFSHTEYLDMQSPLQGALLCHSLCQQLLLFQGAQEKLLQEFFLFSSSFPRWLLPYLAKSTAEINFHTISIKFSNSCVIVDTNRHKSVKEQISQQQHMVWNSQTHLHSPISKGLGNRDVCHTS